MKRRIAFSLLLASLVAIVFLIGSRKSENPAVSTEPTASQRRNSVPAPAPAAAADFRAWNKKHRSAKPSTQELAAGIRLATERKRLMAGWIATDPARALENAVSWSEYQALPEELKPLVEQPFNTIANLRVLPVCDAHAGHEDVRVLEIRQKSWNASVFGQRLAQGTKEATPIAGITLDGHAAIREYSLETLSRTDADTLAELPLGNPDPARDFATGEPLAGNPVVAVAGGRRYLFNDPSTISGMNERLAGFEQTPGPHGGARLVFEMADAGDGSTGIQWEEAGELVQVAASSWTENPKSVFFIRVDFSDQPGEVVSQAALTQVLNNTVASSITEMSYGKTTINAAVSSTTVRMPSPKTTYLPGNNDALYNDAFAAYEAIAGPTSLDGYDIVGVHFPSIGISSGGVTYAGLAGGSRQWLQGTSNSGVIIHEFGHNYGIGHASFWDTSDGSVVGTGGSVEYGDPFDIMGGGPDPEGHFHMQAKQKLNWLGATEWADATASGSGIYRIHRFDNPLTTGTLRGLRVTKAASPAEYYWLGHRPGIPGNPWLKNGAYLVWQRPGFTRSWLLDTTPDSPGNKDDAALSVGATYSDAAAAVHLTPLATGGSGADSWLDVNVQLGSFPGNLPPTATLNAPAIADARASVPFSVSASDGNGDTLAYSWDFGDSSVSSNSPTISHSWAVGGIYTVKVTVTDMKGGVVTKTGSVTVSDPLATWSAGTVAVGRTMSVVSYLDGRFVAGGNQYAYLSFDGVNWTEQYLGLNFRSGGFAFDAGKFVSVGFDWNGSAWYGTIHHSVDGRSWQTASLPASVELRDVAAGGGVFVAVGDAGTILRSTDGGATWASQVPPGAASLDAVAYGAGVFVAVGDAAVYTSPDGVSWTNHSAGSQLEAWQSFRDVEFADGRFFAGGWYSGVRVSSDGGATWQTSSILGGASYDISSITAGSGVFVATAGRQTSPAGPVLLVSQDGETWEESGVGSFPGTSTMTHGGGVFLTVYGSAGASFRSSSLNPFNQAPTAAISAPATANARENVSFSASGLGDGDGDPLILIWDFKDGTPLQKGSGASHAFPAGGVYSVDLIATDTRGGVTLVSHSITITDPLVDWTARSSGTTLSLRDITAGNGALVAVGGTSYFRSTDGISWSAGSVGLNAYMAGITHDGSQFIAVGQDYKSSNPNRGWYGGIYTSANGTTWTSRLLAGASYLTDVAYGGGAYVAVGDAGTMWYSTNATSWTSISSGVSVDLAGVSYGNGGFVAVGSASNGGGGVVLSSPDGVSWTNNSAGAGLLNWQGFYDVQFCNDRFLASGWYSKIRHSTDNGTTFVSNESATRQIPAFSYGNGVYLAAGIDKDNANADINLISIDGTTWTPLATAAQEDRNAAVFFNNTFITVGLAGKIWQSGTFTAPVENNYASWLTENFPGSPPLSGAADDFDGDGIPNLGEYATGTDPLDHGDHADLSASVTGDHFTITIPKAAGVTDVGILVESSTDLQSWSGVGTTIVEDSASQLVVRITAPVSSAVPPLGFLRVRFVQGS